MRAGIYARRSVADDDQEEGRYSASTEDQLTDCRARSKEHGWTVVEEYPEDATSAFAKKTVTLPDGRKVKRNVRPIWQQMMADLYDGKIDALMVYDLDRAMREPRDLEDLIEIVEATGRPVKSVTGSLDLDPADDTGILAARIGASVANKSSRDTRRRVTRASKRRAEAGEWHGGHVPHGYRAEVGADGKSRLVIDPATAPLMREAADRLLTGESLYAVANDFNRRKLLTSRGSQWRSQTIRKAMLSPSIIGKREYDGELFPGQWEPLISEKAWERLRALLQDPSRKFGPMDGSYAGKRPLGGGLTVCAAVLESGEVCGRPLVSAIYRGEPRLVCHQQAKFGCGKVAIKYEPFEQFVLDMVVEAINSPRWRAENARKDTKADTRADRLRIERKALQEELSRAERLFIKGHKSENWYDDEHERVSRLIAGLQKQLDALAAEAARPDVENREDALALWQAAAEDPVKRRRFLASIILEVQVKPWPKGKATRLTRKSSERLAARRGESVETEEEFAVRYETHMREVMRDRVTIAWRI